MKLLSIVSQFRFLALIMILMVVTQDSNGYYYGHSYQAEEYQQQQPIYQPEPPRAPPPAPYTPLHVLPQIYRQRQRQGQVQQPFIPLQSLPPIRPLVRKILQAVEHRMPDPEVEEGRAQKNTDRILNKIEQASKYNNRRQRKGQQLTKKLNDIRKKYARKRYKVYRH